jgi:hypothetical protein
LNKDFIPARNSSLNSFVENFIRRLDIHSRGLSMNAGEVEEAKSTLEKHKRSFSKMISLKAESKSATEEYYTGKKETIDLIRRISNLIKTSKKYTSSIGEDFGIINRSPKEKDFSEHKPVLKAMVTGSRVTIKFTKKGTDGIRLYSKRGNEKEFTELAYAFKNTYTDKRPKLSASNPEAREYFAFYIVNDKTTGLRSNVIKVIIP